MHCLKVKRPLPEKSTYQSAVLDMRLDLLKDLVFGVSRRANEDNISLLNDFLCLVRYYICLLYTSDAADEL